MFSGNSAAGRGGAQAVSKKKGIIINSFILFIFHLKSIFVVFQLTIR
ncbi:hypothetical protein [Legionella sp. WA2024007413]